jgi:hypothetical protein
MTVSVRWGNLGTATTDITSKVRQASAPGASVQAPVWSLTEGAEKGTMSTSGFMVEDPTAAQTIVGLKECHFEDSACVDPTIFAGFFDVRAVSRAVALLTGGARAWDAQVTDLNVLLGDHIIDSGKRPAETDIQRIDWLLASGYLPIGDAGFIDRTGPTNLPAADYTGRFPSDVLAECSNLSGRNYFVRWEQVCTFADCTSPWAAAMASSYVAPFFNGVSWVASSLDVLGGKWTVSGTPTYVAAGSPYTSTHALSTSGDVNFGSQQVNANNGTNFGFGTSGNYVTGTGMGADGRWVWDLNAAGLPRIATIGIVEWTRGVLGYPAAGNWYIEYSDDGTNWTVLFDQTAITAAVVQGSTSILSVPVCAGQHRYWSLHMIASVPGTNNAWASWALGLLLWSGSNSGPGPALGYHALNWAGDTSTLAISNVLADIDNVTTFGPSPGDKLTRDPARVFSGVWFEYNGGHVYVTNGTTLANFRHRDVRASDLNCTTAAAATDLANAYLARITSEEDRITINIDRVPAASVNKARPGQRIPVKFSHQPGYSAGAYLVILRRTVSPQRNGLYRLMLECAQPVFTGFNASVFLAPSLWHSPGAVVATSNNPTTALVGQWIDPTVIGTGDGVTTLFTLGSAYQTGSVRVWVDGQAVPQASITETSATQITLDFAPAGVRGSTSAQSVVASWQKA